MDYPERKTLDDKAMFDDIVQGILSAMGDDAVKIILYGSVARGDNTWESDVDIAVLSKRHYSWKDREKIYDVTAPLGLEYNTLFSVRVIEQNYFNDWKYDMPFFYNISEEGITLWTRNAA